MKKDSKATKFVIGLHNGPLHPTGILNISVCEKRETKVPGKHWTTTRNWEERNFSILVITFLTPADTCKQICQKCYLKIQFV